MRAPPYSEQSDELFSADSIENPHRLYAELRERTPLAQIGETGVHLVSTWDLIEEVLGREEDFSANLTGVLIRGQDGQPSVFELPPSAAARVIATADEPDHAVHRAIAQPQLANRQTAQLEQPVRAWAQTAIADWISQGGGDFVPVAELIPARVVARLLGLPDGDVTRHRTWAMMGGDMLAGDASQDRLTTLAVETFKMIDYLGEHLERARAELQPDTEGPLLHALARAVNQKEVAADEAVGIASVMFGAGGESTAALIGSVARILAESAQLEDQLRSDTNLIPRFVEEVARLEPPFKFHYRAVRTKCQLGDADLEPGDRLMLLWASANRDVAHFDSPNELRLDRKHPRQHLSFGRGPHFCIGAPLARLEAKIVCEELLAQTTQLAIADRQAPIYTPSIFVRRLEHLPLEATKT